MIIAIAKKIPIVQGIPKRAHTMLIGSTRFILCSGFLVPVGETVTTTKEDKCMLTVYIMKSVKHVLQAMYILLQSRMIYPTMVSIRKSHLYLLISCEFQSLYTILRELPIIQHMLCKITLCMGNRL